jgi:outer membrane lipoprotein LolB
MIRLAALVGAAMLLIGCARTAVLDDGLSQNQRQQQLRSLAAWDLEGRLAVDTGERGYQAGVRWRQRDAALDLTVRGLLGAGSFQIVGDGANLTIRARGESEVLSDPERQLSEKFGWWLPVTSLEHWLLGQADPAFDDRSVRGSGGTLASLEQRSWSIAYEEYQLAAGLLVPRRMTLRHSTLELRLSITGWEPVTAEP